MKIWGTRSETDLIYLRKTLRKKRDSAGDVQVLKNPMKEGPKRRQEGELHQTNS